MEDVDGIYFYRAKLVKGGNSDRLVLILRNSEKQFLDREVYEEALRGIKGFFETEIEISLPFSINTRGHTAWHPLDPHFEIVVPQVIFEKYEEEKRTSDTRGESSEEKG